MPDSQSPNAQQQYDAQADLEQEREAARALRAAYELPRNISDLKAFAWGTFTWRDLFVCGGILLAAYVLTMPVQALAGQFVGIVLALLLAAPLLFVALAHHWNGDLPIEDRIVIAMDNWGKSDLLVWDKTMMGGSYVGTSTHDFVPQVTFHDNGIVTLPNNGGGFSVLRVLCDDSDYAKPTERIRMRNGFADLLNTLIPPERAGIPIQILLKASRQNLTPYLEAARGDLRRIEAEGDPAAPSAGQIMRTMRAGDYVAYMERKAAADVFFYDYYLVVTNREDAEEVGNESLKSASVTRQRLIDSMNPMSKREEAAKNVETDVGESRKEAIREAMAQNEFSEQNTMVTVEKRTRDVMNSIKRSGSSNTALSSAMLSREEVAKLFYQCYNADDGVPLDSVIEQSLFPKSALASDVVHRDFPDLFRGAAAGDGNGVG